MSEVERKSHDGKWAIRGKWNSRATSIHRKQGTAAQIACDIAKTEKSETTLPGRNGKIRDKDSYGNDTGPTRDREH